MRKVDAIRKVGELGLPHPPWEYVTDVSQLEYIGEKWIGYDGWLVRTCVGYGPERHLPCEAHISKEEVPGTIERFKEELANREITGYHIFVVHPCWHFVVAGNMRLTPDEVIIDAYGGDTKHRDSDGKTPDLTATYQRSIGSFRKSIKGDRSILSAGNILELLRWARLLDEDYALLEWSKTVDRRLFCHEARV